MTITTRKCSVKTEFRLTLNNMMLQYVIEQHVYVCLFFFSEKKNTTCFFFPLLNKKALDLMFLLNKKHSQVSKVHSLATLQQISCTSLNYEKTHKLTTQRSLNYVILLKLADIFYFNFVRTPVYLQTSRTNFGPALNKPRAAWANVLGQ